MSEGFDSKAARASADGYRARAQAVGAGSGGAVKAAIDRQAAEDRPRVVVTKPRVNRKT